MISGIIAFYLLGLVVAVSVALMLHMEHQFGEMDYLFIAIFFPFIVIYMVLRFFISKFKR